MDWGTVAALVSAFGVVNTAWLGAAVYFVRVEVRLAIAANNEVLLDRINGTYMRTKVWAPRIERLEDEGGACL